MIDPPMDRPSRGISRLQLKRPVGVELPERAVRRRRVPGYQRHATVSCRRATVRGDREERTGLPKRCSFYWCRNYQKVCSVFDR
jgi:hypothetical protein